MTNTPLAWLNRATSIIAIGSIAVASVGCNVGPKYKRPVYPAPPAFQGADGILVDGDSQTSIGDRQWTEVFREPELQGLIRTALANNYDVRIAAQRILEQQAQVQVARSQQFPTITAGGTGIGVDIPSLGSGGSFSSPIAEGLFALNASWTPDFWGLYRKQAEAARDQLLAQVWAQRAVRMTLIESVVTTYVQLRALDKQLEITKQTLKVRQDSVQLTTELERGGSAPLSDVRQAEQLLFTATSQIPQIEQQIQQQENTLSLLLGANPGPIAHTDPNALTPPPESLPTGLPSQLLERRPDIGQAEATLKAANANVGVARAQFFPQLSLSAAAGVGGDSFPTIFGSNSRTIAGLGQLAQPIFEGGKLHGQLKLSEATKQEMVLSYQKTIAGALRDVSNALVASNKQRAYREQQEKLVGSAQDATRLARLRYQGGATAYLEVLTTDSNLFAAQLNLAIAEQSEALTLVGLYSALGGGWQ
ncbi:efflux transporter outer membrane subunit [Granulicella mallensis]|uniref:RND efflux system, outer membrane lipoprotein, NodT family n=1 Tax=Granulicella mallensis (strain ATCC BAA-1857 / DSM 23137 / MP5ACTX8) TaxID=682795 RepID=G8P0D4_GRAMM|nr:efflux transporter outer membrane subunit [Granulicella mallensis]AEU38022.1 RND efflux system, outer membrane lipoprotein, NodT family [Granulicella mallensis MP5ACTX8]